VGLAQVAKAHGLSKMSKRAAISRMGLYKILSGNGNPELKTFMKLLNASGLQLSFKPAKLAA
jgi:probable addiction module antidote protein